MSLKHKETKTKTLIYKGVIASKKNSKQIITNRRTGRPMLISSRQARENAADMIATFMLSQPPEPIAKPCRLIIEIYEPDHRRRDLDNQGTAIIDALVDAGILADDSVKVIIEITTRLAGFDKENPRAVITIKEAHDK